jgi:putative phosphoserine phosphatase/1-acylglycerol-3-phosphate O-acyltransferase
MPEAGHAAAFFDLDRTLLRGASGPLIQEALVISGLAPDRRIPGQGILYRFYDLIGETLPSMALARGAALFSKGWTPKGVQEAAEVAAELLDELVAPYARPLIEEHRAAGRPVVLATTTPEELVRPLAGRLNADDVVATRYAREAGRDGDWVFTGGLEGEFVWAQGKLAAVRRWSEAHGVDLGASYAYSDSIYDMPLLNAVGHPTAVNPDPRLAIVASLRRWPILHLDVPPGVPKLVGLEPFDLLGLFTRPSLFPYARFDIAGVDQVPRLGPAIIVANHRSYFDTAAIGVLMVQAGRAPRFLGKKEVFDAPVIGSLARALGGIRVDRGSGSGEPLREATRALAAGDVVVLMPQGTIPRGLQFFEPELQGRPGAARLAARTGAPVIPVGLWGTERVWPRSSRLPNLLNVTSPPLVTIRVGPPVPGLSRRDTPADIAADTTRIMEAIMALLPSESRVRRAPSPDELARTLPPGHH